MQLGKRLKHKEQVGLCNLLMRQNGAISDSTITRVAPSYRTHISDINIGQDIRKYVRLWLIKSINTNTEKNNDHKHGPVGFTIFHSKCNALDRWR